jgi:hypothetical protein
LTYGKSILPLSRENKKIAGSVRFLDSTGQDLRLAVVISDNEDEILAYKR